MFRVRYYSLLSLLHIHRAFFAFHVANKKKSVELMFFRRVFALRERSRCFPSRALFSSITIKIFLTHGLSPPNSTLVIPRIFTAPISPRLMKRRTVDSRKPIFEKDGVSLEIYSYLFFSTLLFFFPVFFFLSLFFPFIFLSTSSYFHCA